MATVNYVEFKDFTILVGDGAQPTEAFAPRCTINLERGFNISPNYQDTELPDCADDSLPASIFKALTSVSAEVSGSGVVENADVEFFTDWLLQNQTKNVRVVIGTSGAGNGKQFTFPAKIGQFDITASKNGVTNADISIVSNGAIVSADIP